MAARRQARTLHLNDRMSLRVHTLGEGPPEAQPGPISALGSSDARGDAFGPGVPQPRASGPEEQARLSEALSVRDLPRFTRDVKSLAVVIESSEFVTPELRERYPVFRRAARVLHLGFSLLALRVDPNLLKGTSFTVFSSNLLSSPKEDVPQLQDDGSFNTEEEFQAVSSDLQALLSSASPEGILSAYYSLLHLFICLTRVNDEAFYLTWLFDLAAQFFVYTAPYFTKGAVWPGASPSPQGVAFPIVDQGRGRSYLASFVWIMANIMFDGPAEQVVRRFLQGDLVKAVLALFYVGQDPSCLEILSWMLFNHAAVLATDRCTSFCYLAELDAYYFLGMQLTNFFVEYFRCFEVWAAPYVLRRVYGWMGGLGGGAGEGRENHGSPAGLANSPSLQQHVLPSAAMMARLGVTSLEGGKYVIKTLVQLSKFLERYSAAYPPAVRVRVSEGFVRNFDFCTLVALDIFPLSVLSYSESFTLIRTNFAMLVGMLLCNLDRDEIRPLLDTGIFSAMVAELQPLALGAHLDASGALNSRLVPGTWSSGFAAPAAQKSALAFSLAPASVSASPTSPGPAPLPTSAPESASLGPFEKPLDASPIPPSGTLSPEALAKCASAFPDNTRILTLADLLTFTTNSHAVDLCKQILWALSNLANDYPDLFLDGRLLSILAYHFRSPHVRILKEAAYAFYHIVYYMPSQDMDRLVELVIPADILQQASSARLEDEYELYGSEDAYDAVGFGRGAVGEQAQLSALSQLSGERAGFNLVAEVSDAVHRLLDYLDRGKSEAITPLKRLIDLITLLASRSYAIRVIYYEKLMDILMLCQESKHPELDAYSEYLLGRVEDSMD